MRIRVVASDATVTGLLDQGSNLHTLETRLLDEALGRAGGNLARAARQLGISCPQLAYRLKKRGVADKKASPANKPATLP
ncbi:MAG: helix-turn-helix domain-containing protein [Immundisolibacter sp.]